jgi:hypothetical protein
MGTLLETIGIVLETHFRFGFSNESPLGDSLSTGSSHGPVLKGPARARAGS